MELNYIRIIACLVLLKQWTLHFMYVYIIYIYHDHHIGYVSWRNSEYGSWFIKAFVDTMNILTPTEHFMDIMVEVNRRVAMEFQSKGRNKQIPAPVVMLTRKLYFRPGIYEK